MLDVYAVYQPRQIHPDCLRRLMARVPQTKQERLNRYLRWQDAQRGLIAEILVRCLISKKLGIDNRDIAFTANKYGKPFLAGDDRFQFNVSHSGDWVVAAFDAQPLGIDIEAIQPKRLEIAKRFFAPEEYAYLISLPQARQVAAFFDLWTLKESYIKAVGKGLSLALDSFTVIIPDTPNSSGEPTIHLKNDPVPHYFKQYPVDPGYRLSVCCTAPIVDDQLTVMALHEWESWVFEIIRPTPM